MPYSGASYINTSRYKEGLTDKFVTEKAPRTAVVVHKNGTLSLMQVRLHKNTKKHNTLMSPPTPLLCSDNVALSEVPFQVDGEEDISAGLDLLEFSEVLVQFEAWQAVVSLEYPTMDEEICIFCCRTLTVVGAVFRCTRER